MKTTPLILLLATLVLTATAPAQTVTPPASGLRLTLPPVIYAVPGVEMNLYFANVVLAGPDTAPSFKVNCAIGQTLSNRWSLVATAAQVGDHALTLRATGSAPGSAQEAKTVVRIVRAEAGRAQDIALLIVGDSLTAASVYPKELARLLSEPGNPKWLMFGANKSPAPDRAAHEGYGGWTWNRFNTLFDAGSPVAGRVTSSPFVAATGPQQQPRLDVAHYIAKRCDGRAPDFATFLLGINDCFSLKASEPAALDEGITRVLTEADKLLAAFRQAAPKAELGIALTPPPNTRDGAFEANYKGTRPRANWRAVQHRLVERQLEHFRGREAEGIFIIPTELNLDPTAGYPDNNGVHPNPAGYRQLAASFHAWLKWRLDERDKLAARK